MKRLISPLGALAAGLLGVLLGRIFIDGARLKAALVLGTGLLLVLMFFRAGKAVMKHYPVAGAYMMESSVALLLAAAALGSAVIFWMAVRWAPGKDASESTKQTVAGITGAIGTYLGATVGKLDFPSNPVKTAIRSTFADQFRTRRDDVEKDARDAIDLESYGSMTGTSHVSGWGWDARRVRARHLQTAVDKGYLS